MRKEKAKEKKPKALAKAAAKKAAVEEKAKAATAKKKLTDATAIHNKAQMALLDAEATLSLPQTKMMSPEFLASLKNMLESMSEAVRKCARIQAANGVTDVELPFATTTANVEIAAMKSATKLLKDLVAKLNKYTA